MNQRTEPVCLADFQELARERMRADVWDFVEGGAERERTMAANQAAFDRVAIRPRVMVNVTHCDTRTTILGAPVTSPIAIAPTAYHRLIHPQGETATARGAGAVGALYVVSIFASQSLEDIARAASGPLWLQLYWLYRRDVMADMITRAERAGYAAIVLTVDVPRMGRRWRDMRNAFTVDPDVGAANIEPTLMAIAHQSDVGQSSIAQHAALTHDPSLTWDDIAWLRAQTSLPIVLKGIMSGADARAAHAYGVDGIIVSNHGGRQLDGAMASLDALPAVVEAIGEHLPVFFDGGIRGGVDAFTALALGAEAVFVGRAPLWGLAVDGADGVAAVLRMATEELAHTMALAGRPALRDLDRTATSVEARWS